MTITMSDSQGRAIRRFHLTNAWASKWEGSSPDSSDVDPALERVTIAYEDLTVE
ncbi:phage tail protein [Streptomyces sp. NPDC021622]|uniref:phage tail protein n=1 Tax=Streptomyces sp. NPDC021622 TaxID=3155013 RepID=UPI0034024E93